MLISRIIVGRMRRIAPRLSCARGIGEFCPRSWVASGVFNSYRDRYDFDLVTGKSDTGLQACVYEVRVRQTESDGEAEVWVEAPRGGTGWQSVNLRPVSEGGFAYSPPKTRLTHPLRFRRPPSGSEYQRFCVTSSATHGHPDLSRSHRPRGRPPNNFGRMGCSDPQYTGPHSQG